MRGVPIIITHRVLFIFAAVVLLVVAFAGVVGKPEHYHHRHRALGPWFHLEPPSTFAFSNETGGVLDCVVGGTPYPKVTWRFDRGVTHTTDLYTVLPHNRSLHFRPFHANEFDPAIHGSAVRCQAESQSGKIISRRIAVKAGKHINCYRPA